MADDFWAKTTRLMLASVKEVGAMPFILFEYYLTWQTAPDGIKPSLQRIADDLGMEKNAVCNLRSRLIKAGWIRYENDEVFITKSFTKNESRSQKMNEKPEKHSQKMNVHSQIVNDDSQKMNESFTKNESHIRNSKNIQKEQEKEQLEELPKTATAAPSNPKPVRVDVDFENLVSLCYAMNSPTERKMLSKTQRMQIIQTLKIMRESDCDLSKIPKFAEWWRLDWRSKDRSQKYQSPSPVKVRECWAEAMKSTELTEERAETITKYGATNAITKQTNYQTTADRRDERAIAEFQLTESIRARLNSGGNL